MSGLPYRLGENSPPINTHSPPISLTHLPVTPTVLRPQPHLPQALTTPSAATGPSSNGSPNLMHHHSATAAAPTSPQQISPLRIRVNSPSRLNASTDLANHCLAQAMNGGIVRIAHPSIAGQTILHRPFSTSPKLKEHS
jgi:hypothetical protein